MNATDERLEIEIYFRCAPWSGVPSNRHPVLVEIAPFPRVRVWDPIGKIFTVCHALSPRAQRRIIAAARAEHARKAAG